MHQDHTHEGGPMADFLDTLDTRRRTVAATPQRRKPRRLGAALLAAGALMFRTRRSPRG